MSLWKHLYKQLRVPRREKTKVSFLLLNKNPKIFKYFFLFAYIYAYRCLEARVEKVSKSKIKTCGMVSHAFIFLLIFIYSFCINAAAAKATSATHNTKVHICVTACLYLTLNPFHYIIFIIYTKSLRT